MLETFYVILLTWRNGRIKQRVLIIRHFFAGNTRTTPAQPHFKNK